MQEHSRDKHDICVDKFIILFYVYTFQRSCSNSNSDHSVYNI